MLNGEQDKYMKFLQTKKILIKKIIIIILILAMQVTGLGLFYVYQGYVYNFKTSYIKKIYLPISKYKLKNVRNLAKAADKKIINEIRQTKSIPVLLYHGVIEEDDGYNTTLDDFRDQMFALKADGYQTVNLEDFQKFMKDEIVLPKKSILITFDDARKDSFYPVDPFLRTLNYEAVMFVITKYSMVPQDSDETFFLNKKELKILSDSNHWSVQSHSHDGHDIYKINNRGKEGYYLTDRLWLESEQRNETKQEFRQRVRADLLKSKNILEKELGKEVVGYAYPFGELGQDDEHNYSQAEEVVIEEASKVYSYSFHQVWTDPRKRTYPDKDDFLIRRIDVLAGWDGEDLVNVLDQTEDKQLPYSDDFSTNHGWFASWGNISTTDNSLYLTSTRTDQGSMAVLEGSFLWKNIDISAEVNIIQGDSFSLIGAYQDNSFLACNFYEQGLSLTKYNKARGIEELISETNLANILSLKNTKAKVGMRVSEQNISCQLNGSDILVINSSLPNINSEGGIGIRTWGNLGETEVVEIKNLQVKYINNN